MIITLLYFLISAQLLRIAVCGAQSISTTGQSTSTAVQSASTTAVAPERPKRLIDPAPVRHGFIPEEWFQALYPKTGASGKLLS